MATDLSLINKDSLTIKVYLQIKEAIMSGHFQPGERLAMRTLAKKMGTSITPVREALLKLVSLGALEMRPASTITVPILNKKKYLENRTIRLAMEGLGAAEAVQKIKKRGLNRLIKIHEEMIKTIVAGNFKGIIAKNYQFHLELCKAAEMPALLEIVEILWLKIGPSIGLLYPSSTTARSLSKQPNYHQTIIDALVKRDSDAARSAIEEDLVSGGAALLAYFEKMEP